MDCLQEYQLLTSQVRPQGNAILGSDLPRSEHSSEKMIAYVTRKSKSGAGSKHLCIVYCEGGLAEVCVGDRCFPLEMKMGCFSWCGPLE